MTFQNQTKSIPYSRTKFPKRCGRCRYRPSFGHETNKVYGNSLTAPVDIMSTEYTYHLLLFLCETVGTRLRNDNVKISVVSVHITTCEFRCENRQMQLLTATDVTEEIFRAAC